MFLAASVASRSGNAHGTLSYAAASLQLTQLTHNSVVLFSLSERSLLEKFDAEWPRGIEPRALVPSTTAYDVDDDDDDT